MARLSKEERWKPIASQQGHYSVSDCGRVRSEARVVLRKNGRPYNVRLRILKTIVGGHGYRTARVGGRTCNVHELMLLAFVGERPHKHAVCRHLNGNPLDNRLNNLRWGTRAENYADGVEHRRAACLTS